MKTLKIKNQTFHLDSEIRIAPSGRPYRHSGVELVTTEPVIWINGMYQHKTIYKFIYTDEQGGFFSFKFDQRNIFECKQ